MFNTLGKALVLVHLAISVLAMTAAAAIFLQQIDWGWKEPRKNLDVRVPSEIDKRAAALEEAYKALGLVLPELPPAQNQLRAAEARFGPNHLAYGKKLNSLRHDPKPITVKEMKMKGGQPELDLPIIGEPLFGKDDPFIKKSHNSYKDELAALRGDISKVEKQVSALVAKEKELTQKLSGEKDDMGKLVRPGLYELQEIERKRAAQVKFEIEYLKPRWQDTLEEASSFRERRLDLEATLEAIRQGKK